MSDSEMEQIRSKKMKEVEQTTRTTRINLYHQTMANDVVFLSFC
jgi:hypothetical protein